MQNFLTSHEEDELRKQHHRELGRKSADRIKVVLMANDARKYHDIAKVLLLHPDTVIQHIQDYVQNKKLHLESGGKDEKLNPEQAIALEGEVDQPLYAKRQTYAPG